MYFMTSLVPSCSCPLAENIWWFDSNFLLFHLECGMMTSEIIEHIITSCYIMVVHWPPSSILARKRELVLHPFQD